MSVNNYFVGLLIFGLIAILVLGSMDLEYPYEKEKKFCEEELKDIYNASSCRYSRVYSMDRDGCECIDVGYGVVGDYVYTVKTVKMEYWEKNET